MSSREGSDALRGDAGPIEAAEAVRCLLDLDPELGADLDPKLFRLARAAATVITIETEPGRLLLSSWLERACPGPGVLVLDGILALRVRVGGRTTVELLGAGDLLTPAQDAADWLLACDSSWRALVPMRFALLDEGFARRIRFWPQISQALVRRLSSRVINLNIQRAIAAQPRLEVRLALLLWHLASRWGRVEREGVRLCVPLTHQLLGHLVGAERPSISHALARLAQHGLVTGHGDEWHLQGRLEDRLPTMIEPAAESAGMIIAALAPTPAS